MDRRVNGVWTRL